MKRRFTTVDFPVFCYYIVHIEVTSDLKKSMEKYPATKSIPLDSEFDNKGAWSVHVENEPVSFIFLPYNTSVGDIAHESWHVVHRMMRYVGVSPDSETVAYHLGYLVNQVFKFVRGKK